MKDFLTETLGRRWAATGIVRGLDRIRKVLAAMGNPELRIGLRIVVGGTNGKGSTCSLLDNTLRAAGYRVGLYLSPHILTAMERIQVNGADVPRQTLDAALQEVSAAEQRAEVTLTGFEWITAVALSCLAREQVDVSVLEVGLGGRLDAVNAVEPDLTVLTPMDLDHCDILGPEIEDIVREKAALMRSGRPCVCARQSLAVRLALAEELPLHAPRPFLEGGEDFYGEWDPAGGVCVLRADGTEIVRTAAPVLQGSFQLDNIATAAAALDLAEALGLVRQFPPGCMAAGLSTTRRPGRLQRLEYHGRTWFFDVGHNGHAARAVAAALDEAGLRPRTIILGLLATKDPGPVLEALLGLRAKLVFCPIPDHPCHEPEALLAMVPPGFSAAAVTSPIEAFNLVNGVNDGQPALCFGSHYLLGSLCEAVPELARNLLGR